jgi:hypothetical protein
MDESGSRNTFCQCQMSGIPCEERMLPIGDMAWIGCVDPQSKTIVCELMLGIIERKTTSDLKSSLFGTRHWEQRLRLQYSGIPQVLFLIEGDLSKELLQLSGGDSAHCRNGNAFALGISNCADRTYGWDGGCFERMHRRVLQRSFPHAFGQANEACQPCRGWYWGRPTRVFRTRQNHRRRANDYSP